MIVSAPMPQRGGDRAFTWGVCLAGSALLIFSLWPWLGFGPKEKVPRTLVLYGFSILGEAMNEDVLPAFVAAWRQRTGERVEVITAFAGSGTITNQLLMGVPADLAILSLELDAQRLALAGVTRPDSWRRLPNQGILNRTPFIFVVRPGNPKRIRDFGDLARSGVAVVHPDPLTSGGANWALLAEYGSAARRAPGAPAEAGYRSLLGVWRNVRAQAASARAARTQFENGFGDVLITYEQDVLEDHLRGRLAGDLVYPPSTVLSAHTVVVVERNVRPSERPLVRALVEFLWSKEAQRLFVRRGFRSDDASLNVENPGFGVIRDPFTVEDFGGWSRVKREVVEGLWKQRVLPELGR